MDNKCVLTKTDNHLLSDSIIDNESLETKSTQQTEDEIIKLNQLINDKIVISNANHLPID